MSDRSLKIIDMLVMDLDIRAKPLQRHRYRKVGNKIITYDPSSSDKKELIKLVKQQAIVLQDVKMPHDGPIWLDIIAFFARPKSHFVNNNLERGKLKAKSPDAENCIKKPDCSNILKFVEDALEGIFFKNDSQIIKATAGKQWSNKDSISIAMYFLREDSNE